MLSALASHTLNADAVAAYLTRTKQLDRDVRADPYWQIRDVDFFLKGGTAVYVQLTKPKHTTSGKLFFEVQREYGGPGRFSSSKADYWYFLNPETKEYCRFRLADAQTWLLKHLGTEVAVRTNNRNRGWVRGEDRFVDYIGYVVDLQAFSAGVTVDRIPSGVSPVA